MAQTIVSRESVAGADVTVRPNRLIAISKRPTAVDEAGVSATDQKRAVMAETTGHESPYAHELAALGLTAEAARQDPPTRDDALSAFRSLPFLDSYVIDARNADQALAVQDVLAPDYHVMADIPFALSPTRATGGRLEAAAAQSAWRAWPKETGIHSAHEGGNRGDGVVVAILDTGVDADHSEFQDRTVNYLWTALHPSGRDRQVRGFDTVSHGTHVAGIVAGRNLGMAPGVDLLVAAVIESESVTTSMNRIITALEWVTRYISRAENRNRPVVLNMSLGFHRSWLQTQEVENALRGVQLLLMKLVRIYDVLPVVAVGNDGPGNPLAPAYFPEALSVGAVDNNLNPADFSAGGPGPHPFADIETPTLSGLGVDILSSLERDIDGGSWYGRKSGTSMATPYVTGIAALVAARTGLQGSALRQHLVDTAMPLSSPSNRVGAGLARYTL